MNRSFLSLLILGTFLLSTATFASPQANESLATHQPKKNEFLEFTKCASLSEFEDKEWYPAISKNEALKGASDACYSENDNLLITITPGDYCQGSTIYKLNTVSQKLEKATVINNRGDNCLASPEKFENYVNGKFSLQGVEGDAGYAARMFFEYDPVSNILELKKEYIYSVNDPENGEWYYY